MGQHKRWPDPVRTMRACAMALAFVLLAAVTGQSAIPAQEKAGPESQSAPVTQQSATPDQLQAQYIEKHQAIHSELKSVHNKLLANLKLQSLELNRLDPKQPRGPTTSEVRMAYVGLRAEQRNLEIRIRQLNSSSLALKQEAQQSYNGKIPKDVSDAWAVTESDYAVFLEGFSEELKKNKLEGQRMK